MMIRRLLKIFPAVYKVLYENKKNHLILTEVEIANLEQLVAVLTKFEKATKMVSSEKAPTAGLILPMMYQLTKHLAECEADFPMIKRCKAAMLDDLSKRYDGEKVQRLLQKASIVDPRFKHLAWIKDETKEEWYQSIREYCIAIGRELDDDNSGTEEAESVQQGDSGGGFFDEEMFTPVHKERLDVPTKVDDEIQRYLREPVPDENCNAVEWWKSRKIGYPILHQVAARFLMVQATSVASERVFSTAGAIVTKKRSALAPTNVNMLLFLNKNCKYYKHD